MRLSIISEKSDKSGKTDLLTASINTKKND